MDIGGHFWFWKSILWSQAKKCSRYLKKLFFSSLAISKCLEVKQVYFDKNSGTICQLDGKYESFPPRTFRYTKRRESREPLDTEIWEWQQVGKRKLIVNGNWNIENIPFDISQWILASSYSNPFSNHLSFSDVFRVPPCCFLAIKNPKTYFSFFLTNELNFAPPLFPFKWPVFSLTPSKPSCILCWTNEPVHCKCDIWNHLPGDVQTP